MALRFLDSFDHLTTLTQKWTAATANNTIAAAALRTGIAGMRSSGANGPYFCTLTLDAQGTWTIGVAYRIASALQTDKIRTLDAGSVQGALRLNADLTLSLLRGGAVVATSVQSLLVNTYYYIEFRHIILNVGGTLEVRVNGAVWATFNGDTQATANATANQVAIGGGGTGGTSGTDDMDDLYILDGTGAAPNNDYWGDTQIEALVPTGAGNYTEWTTLVGAPTHWQAVDEVPPDEDTTYVESSTLNHRDTYAFGNLSVVSAQINGIQVLMRARETVAGGGAVARLYRQGVTDNQGADVLIGTSYAYTREIMETDPIAVAAWTVAAINSAEFGARVR